MKVNQIYQLLNSISQQTFGETAPTATDLTGLISMGETITSTNDKDKFFNTLVDRIGKTIIRTLDLSVAFPNILQDSFEFGAILQKITVEPMSATESEPWKIGNNNYTPNQFAISKATVRQSLFSGINVWSVKTTIPDNIVKSAFTNETEMASLINGIIDSMRKSIVLQISEMNRFCVNNFIGEKIYVNKNVVHLATEFNTAFSPTTNINVDNCLYSAEFARFTTKRIGDYMRYLKNPTKLFNHDNVVRETQRDNMHIFMLGEFASAFNIYLQSDVFHNELTKLPLYEEVDFWQSMKDATEGSTSANFASSSTIDLTTSSGHAVEKSGVICALIDRQALGTTAYNNRVTTDRNNDGEYTNYSNKVDIGYYNDMSENGVVFVVD